MNIIDKTLINVKVRLQKGVHDFVTTEDGDTNFVSMLIIIAVVVVMAGAFLGVVKNSLLPELDKTVKNFIKNPTVK